jgi:Na+-transporting NADH:ubiquinone oxidoreductase subunit C
MSEATAPDSTRRALVVALAVAFVCGLLVSAVAVTLRPVQRANVEAERMAQLQLVLDALSGIGRELAIDSLEQHMVELASGRFDDSIDADRFDAERAAASPTEGTAIPPELDVAGLKRRALHARIYLVRDDRGEVDLVILPVSGRGYQSTLHAWLVLDGDARTVRALKFYQHGETPGVGARIEDPDWEAKWRDLPAYDENGVLRIGVRSGSGYSENAAYQVDSISGATRTSQGVDGMLRFWLGDFGYAALLRRIREGQV